MGRRGIRPLGQHCRGEPAERLDRRGHRPPGPAQRAEGGVLDHLVLVEPPPPRHGTGATALCDSVIALEQGVLAVREPVELEMIVALREFAEPREYLVE